MFLCVSTPSSPIDRPTTHPYTSYKPTHLSHQRQRLRRNLALVVRQGIAHEGKKDAVVDYSCLLLQMFVCICVGREGSEAMHACASSSRCFTHVIYSMTGQPQRERERRTPSCSSSVCSRRSSCIASASRPDAPNTSTTWSSHTHSGKVGHLLSATVNGREGRERIGFVNEKLREDALYELSEGERPNHMHRHTPRSHSCRSPSGTPGNRG